MGWLTDVKVGDVVYVIGSPEGLEETLSEGIVAGKRSVSGVEQLQISAPISPGSSGSPVFNKFGDVIGMVVAYFKEGQQLNFAVSVASLLSRPWGIPISQALSKTSGPVNKTPSLAIKDLESIFRSTAGSLNEAPDFQLLIEDFPEELKRFVTKENVQSWTEAELARSAPRASIITEEQAKKRLNIAGSSPEFIKRLANADDFARELYVEIGFMQVNGTGQNVYTVNVAFSRPGINSSGLRFGNRVWQSRSFGIFGRANSVEQVLRDTVQDHVKRFADEWVRQNKPQSP